MAASSPTSPLPASISCPSPESRIDLYTEARLQDGLQFAESFLGRRNITPRSALFIAAYHFDRGRFKRETRGDKDGHGGGEAHSREKNFLRPLKHTKVEELETILLQLRGLQYITRYGDYLKTIPTRLRIESRKLETQGFQLLAASR